MEKYVKYLKEEQLKLLKRIKPGFENIPSEDLYDWLCDYYQEQGLEEEDFKNNPEQYIVEDIIDVLVKLSYREDL